MKHIAIIRGGNNEGYERSMLSGRAVLDALDVSDYRAKDIVITKTGDWIAAGKIQAPSQALAGVTHVLLALQSDAKDVQRLLEANRIAYTGSSAFASGVACNKELSKQSLKAAGATTARHRRIDQSEKQSLQQELEQIITDLGTELYIKPLTAQSPEHYRAVSETQELYDNLVEMLDLHNSLLIEQRMPGIAASVGLLDGYRNEPLYAFPAVTQHDQVLQVGRFSAQAKAEMARIARLAHTTLGCQGYSMTDFIVNQDDVLFLKIDSHPNLATTDYFPSAAETVGLDYKSLIIHLLDNT